MAALAAALATAVSAYNNGMGERPPMGWQTWCSVGECGEDHCFDGQIRAMADTLVLSGMKDLGYDWVVLDDCWHPTRDNATAELVPYPRFFPDGMKPVIDYVHSLGLKFGLYTSVGDRTCHGGWSPGSFGHYERDARTFAAWGVDYVKIDYCGSHDSVEGHRNMSRALNATGRPMSFMLCRGPYQQQDHWGYAPGIAQGWRATGDHHDNFASVRQQVGAVPLDRGCPATQPRQRALPAGGGCTREGELERAVWVGLPRHDDDGRAGLQGPVRWARVGPGTLQLDKAGALPRDERGRVPHRGLALRGCLLPADGRHGHPAHDSNHEGAAARRGVEHA